jgi:glycosyltransferase involved in cell wall biosynthesis
MENKKRTITLGIPTYNRRSAIVGNLSHLISNQITDLCNILIIDNDSSDGSFDELATLGAQLEKISLLRNETNIGGCANIISLFEECKTDYLIICSDEDYVIKENLKLLINLLDEVKPSFISPQLYLPGRGIRRGKKIINKVEPREFQLAAGAMSGLVFRVDTCQKLINDNRQELLDQRQQWPHVLLLAYLLMDDDICLWWNKPLVKIIHRLGGGFNNKGDGMISAWEHYKVTLDALETYQKKSNYLQNILAKKLIEYHRSSMIKWLRKGAGKVGLSECFDSSLITHIREVLFRRIRSLISPKRNLNRLKLRRD